MTQHPLQQNSDLGRRTRRIHRRKHDILKVAARLFAERGYEHTTLDMVADELGLSKPSLYYYVKSKEDILADIFQEIFQRILESAQRDGSPNLEPQVRLQHLISAYVAHACVFPEGRMLFLYESYLLSVCNSELRALRDDYQQQVEDAISEGIQQGIFRVPDARLAMHAIVGALHAIPLWYLPDGPLSPLQIGEYYARLLIGGLVAPLDLSSSDALR